jgi:quinolinate synthase
MWKPVAPLPRRSPPRVRLCVPAIPVPRTHVNTSAAVKAESDICCTSGNAKKIIEGLGVPKVIMLPTNTARNTAPRPRSRSSSEGHCEAHERFTVDDIRELRATHPGITVLAHPECPRRSSPNVTSPLDRAMADYVGQQRPGRVVLLTECTATPSRCNTPISTLRGRAPCPHMKRITLPKIRHALETMAMRSPSRRDRRPGALSVERMLARLEPNAAMLRLLVELIVRPHAKGSRPRRRQ